MLGVRPIVFGWAATLVAMTGAVAAGRQAQPPSGDAPQMIEKVFKDIQVFNGITVDEFMETMGMFAAATTKAVRGVRIPEDSGQGNPRGVADFREGGPYVFGSALTLTRWYRNDTSTRMTPTTRKPITR